MCVVSDLHLNPGIVITLFMLSSDFFNFLLLNPLPASYTLKSSGSELKHTSKVVTNVASSGVNYREIFFFFPLPLSAHFSVFFISPPVWFPLCGVPFIEIALEVVCVWPARAVIEPICRLAPVGLNPGLMALRWLNVFAMFLKPILFLFQPPCLLPVLPPSTAPTNISPRANKFLIEIDALSFHLVGDPQECILHILFYAA